MHTPLQSQWFDLHWFIKAKNSRWEHDWKNVNVSNFQSTSGKICDFVKWLMFFLYWSVTVAVHQPRPDTNVLFLHSSFPKCQSDGVINRWLWFPEPSLSNIVPLNIPVTCELPRLRQAGDLSGKQHVLQSGLRSKLVFSWLVEWWCWRDACHDWIYWCCCCLHWPCTLTLSSLLSLIIIIPVETPLTWQY